MLSRRRMDSTVETGLRVAIASNDENVPNIPGNDNHNGSSHHVRQMQSPQKLSIGAFSSNSNSSLNSPLPGHSSILGSYASNALLAMHMQGSHTIHMQNLHNNNLELSHASFIGGSPTPWPNSIVAFSPYFGNASSQITPLKFDLNNSFDHASFEESSFLGNDYSMSNMHMLNNSMASQATNATNPNSSPPPAKSKAAVSLELIVEALKKEADAVKKEAELVKKDAANMDKMKAKLKADMETLEAQNLNIKSQLLLSETDKASFQQKVEETESLCSQLKQDMQRLNDIYSEERTANEYHKRNSFSLQQELNKCKYEIGIYMKEFQNMQEIKNQSMSQISELKSTLDNERHNNYAEKKGLEKKIKIAETASSEACKHFWNLTDEVNNLKKDAENFKSIQIDLELNYALRLEKLRGVSECALMANEDSASLLEARAKANKKLIIDFHLLKQEYEALREEVKTKDEAYKVVFKQVKGLQDGRNMEKAEVNSRMLTMNESIKKLKAHIIQLEQELLLSKNQVLALANENPKFAAKIDSLKLQLKEQEMSKKLLEEEHSVEVEELSKTKDELLLKLSANNNQMETIQNQARTLQQKFIDDNQKLKETEKALRDEISWLSREILQVKTAALATYDSDKLQQQDIYRMNMESVTNLVSNLESDLEKRFEENMSLRKERDVLNEKYNSIKSELEEQNHTSKRGEQSLKRNFESDKNAYLFEIKQLQNKVLSLESDNQDKASELNRNKQIISHLQRDNASYRSSTDDQNRITSELKVSLDLVTFNHQKMVEEMRMYVTSDEELRSSMSKLEVARADDAINFDITIKEIKKAAGTQISEANSRNKQLLDQLEELKTQKSEMVGAERRMGHEIDKLKMQYEVERKKYEGSQALLLNDISLLKKELGDYKAKSQKLTDSNSEIESGYVNFKLDRTNLERENARLLENCRDFEVKTNILIERESKLKHDQEIIISDLKATKLLLSEANNRLAEKSNVLDALEKTLSNIDREGQAELRRAKLQLKNAESDLAELKPLVPMLQKELAELKVGQIKQQKANNPDVEDLIKDLRELEATLASERKKYQTDVPALNTKIGDLQTLCESLKENFEDVLAKAKTDIVDKDLIISKLQGQREKMQTLISHKDDRIEDLERLQRTDRTRINDFVDKISSLEKHLVSANSASESSGGDSSFSSSSSSSTALKKSTDFVSRRRGISTDSSNMIGHVSINNNLAAAFSWDRDAAIAIENNTAEGNRGGIVGGLHPHSNDDSSIKDSSSTSTSLHKFDPVIEERSERPSIRRLSGNNKGQFHEENGDIDGDDGEASRYFDDKPPILCPSKSIDSLESFAQGQKEGEKNVPINTTSIMAKSASGPLAGTGKGVLEDHEQWLDRAKAGQARKNIKAREKVKERSKDRESFDYDINSNNNSDNSSGIGGGGTSTSTQPLSSSSTTTTHLPKIANPPSKNKKKGLVSEI